MVLNHERLLEGAGHLTAEWASGMAHLVRR